MVADSLNSTETFWEYFRRSRLLKIALAFNLIYFFGILISSVYLFLQGTIFNTLFAVDFTVFYESGQMFITTPGSIYAVSPNNLPFRYFPSFAAYMGLFSFIPLIPLYLINISIMIICNVGIVYFVYQICMLKGVETLTKNFETALAIVFIAPQNIVNIMFGQITQLAILFTLIALSILESNDHDRFRWYFIVGFLIGLASTIKPFFLIFLPFLIPISIMGKFEISVSIRNFVGVSTGFILTMLPNLVYFILYPSAFQEFLGINLIQTLEGQHSTSLTNLILFFVPNTFPVKVGIILIIGGVIFFRSYLEFLRTPQTQKSFLHHFTDMTFLILLVYPDSWFLFLAVWYAFLAPSILTFYNSQSISDEDMRNLNLLWSGSNNLLGFFWIGIIIHYLVLGFDPMIPIWLLILYLLYQETKARIEMSNSVDKTSPSSL
jgi:hypothetical protein